MRRSSEPEERAQFTVAELLARYGGAAPPTGRRHRRAVEDSDSVVDPAAADPAAVDTAAVDTAAADAAVQPVVERNWVGTREPTVRPSEPLPDLPGRHGSPYVESPQIDFFPELFDPGLSDPGLFDPELFDAELFDAAASQRSCRSRVGPSGRPTIGGCRPSAGHPAASRRASAAEPVRVGRRPGHRPVTAA